MLNLDALLDQSMAEVEAAPNYVEPENGHYILTVADTSADKKKSTKEGQEDYVVLKHQYRIDEVKQQEGMPIAPGSLFSDQWMLTDKGLPYFKARTLDIAEANGEDREALGGLKLSEMLAGVKDMQFQCIIKKTPRSDDSGRFNIRIESIAAV
jgi:hypothetical protein